MGTRLRIAIIGCGISGLAAAHQLHASHELTLFEAGAHIGGHTNTIDVREGDAVIPVDTGFIVFNPAAYPLFCNLLDQLGVASQDSDMSFSVSCERSGLEYAGSSLNTLFAQRRNLIRPVFYRMIRDITRFNRLAPALGASDDRSLGAFLADHSFSQMFAQHYLAPMTAAIWSSSPAGALDIPMRFFTRFFINHGMFDGFRRPTWRTIRGGSRQYVEAIIKPFRERVRVRCPVLAVARSPERVIIRTATDESAFDQVIIATHSDQALRMLADASPRERDVLSAIPYRENPTLLHTDVSDLPRCPRARASWNYRIPRGESAGPTVSYHMNRLQALHCKRDYIVTLGGGDRAGDERVIERILYHHPQFDQRSIAAQQRWREISGHNRTHFCGAYWGYGFHEDGVRSGLAVARDLGARV